MHFGGEQPLSVWSLNVTIHPSYIMDKRQESTAILDDRKKKINYDKSTWITSINSILCVDLLTPFVLYFSENTPPVQPPS